MGPGAGDGYRLSPQQRRLARYGGLDGRLEATVVVTGDVDGRALRAAVDRVVERHEALRTRFVELPGGGLPLQVIDDAGRDATRVDVSHRDGTWRVEVEASAMCLDAASCDVLLSDLASAYAGSAYAGSGDRDDPLQYADVAEWFNGELEAAEEPGRAHWATRRPPVGRPPERAPRPRSAAHRLLGAGERLRRLSGSEGVLPEAVVLTAWNAVVQSTSLPVAPVLGVIRDGRRFSELEPVVGPLEAVAWVRPEDDPRGSGIAASRALGRELEEATAHLESLPVDDPILTAGFRWLRERHVVHARGAEFSLESIRPFEYPFGVLLKGQLHGADLLVEVGALAAEHEGTAQPEPGTLVDRMARLIVSVLDNPGLPMSHHHILSAEETEDAIRRLNPHRSPAAPGPLVLDRLIEHAEARPDATAIIGAEGRLTYGELAERSARLAGRLAGLGAGPEDVVGVLADTSIAWLVAVVAVWRAGGACLAIDSSIPPRRAAAQLAHVRARFAVAPPGRESPLAGVSVVPVGDDADLDDHPFPGEPPHPRQLAFVTFTSGTTGRPKGVAVEHRHMAAYASAIGDVLGVPRSATFASPAAPAADLGMTAWLVALHHGAAIATLPPEAMLDAERFAGTMQRFGVDVLKIAPSHLGALVASAGTRVLPRHTLVLGGERLPPELVARVAELAPHLRIINHYGPTETTVGALVQVVDGAGVSGGEVPIGRALASSLALPGGGGPVPSGGRVAELWLAGPSVARGYFGDPRATADRFRPDPAGGAAGGRAYRTGDMIRIDAAGAAVFAGRDDEQVKIRGTRVELAEVERELRAHPGVTAAVAAATGENPEQRLEAWIVAPAGTEADAVLLRLREVLPDPMVPSRLHVIDAMPLTASGKPDRRALLARRGPERPAGRRPVGDVEVAVAEIFEDLLGQAVVDAEASFFELGGHSLMAMRAIARLRDTLGIGIDVEAFFAGATVAAIAAVAGPEVAARLEVRRAVAGMTDEEVARALERLGSQ